MAESNRQSGENEERIMEIEIKRLRPFKEHPFQVKDPLLPEERNIRMREDGSFYNLEYAKPITIKDNCWLASNVVVCGGVTIGEGCVIGAGSVVTKDITPYSLAVGNPCRVIRKITEKDHMPDGIEKN